MANRLVGLLIVPINLTGFNRKTSAGKSKYETVKRHTLFNGLQAANYDELHKLLDKSLTIKTRLIPNDEGIEPIHLGWSNGVLQEVDEFRTPGYVLARRIAGNLPSQLFKLLGMSEFEYFGQGYSDEISGIRWHESFFTSENGEPAHQGDTRDLEAQKKISPFTLHAAEILTILDPDSYSYLILHLSCTDNPTNLNEFRNLNRLHNKPLKTVLDAFFEVRDDSRSDPQSGVQGLIPKRIRTGVLITFAETNEPSEDVDEGHLAIGLTRNNRNLARFRARYSFLGLLVSIQRDQLQKLVVRWPSLDKGTLQQLIDARLLLGSYLNQWWWPQVMASEKSQRHYELLQQSFGLISQIDALRLEVTDLWDVMNAKNAEAQLKSTKLLNRIALGIAVFGLAPLWINVFESPELGLTALGVSGILLVVILLATKKH